MSSWLQQKWQETFGTLKQKIPQNRPSSFEKKIRHRAWTHVSLNIAFFCTRAQPRVKSLFGYIEINRNYVPLNGHVVNFSEPFALFCAIRRGNFTSKTFCWRSVFAFEQRENAKWWRHWSPMKRAIWFARNEEKCTNKLLRKLDKIFLSQRQYTVHPL